MRLPWVSVVVETHRGSCRKSMTSEVPSLLVTIWWQCDSLETQMWAWSHVSLCGYKVIIQNTFLKKNIESNSYKTKAMKPVYSKDRTSIPKVLFFCFVFCICFSCFCFFSSGLSCSLFILIVDEGGLVGSLARTLFWPCRVGSSAGFV